MLFSNIGESASTPGTGTVTLTGALTGHKAFDDTYSRIVHPATNLKVRYKIVDSNDSTIYERGRGLYTKSGATKTVARTTVYESSSANGLVNFTGAVKVYISLDADSMGPETGARITGTTGGTSTAYTLTNVPALPELLDGQINVIQLHTDCGASPTLNVDGLGAKNLVDIFGNNWASGALKSGSRLLVSYKSSTDKYMVLGVLPLATSAEVSTGTEATKPVAPDTLAANYAGQGKQTIWIPASAMVANTTQGAAFGITETTTYKNMRRYFAFDSAQGESVQFQIRMPKEWNEGTVTFKPIWSTAQTSGGVAWAVAAIALSDGDTHDAQFGGSDYSIDSTDSGAKMYQGPESSGMTIGGSPAAEDLVDFFVWRDVSNGSDTIAGDCYLWGIVLFITTNARNSA